MPSYTLVFATPCLIGIAIIVIAFRANKDDLPEIIRAIMRVGPKDDDDAGGPPSLPKP